MENKSNKEILEGLSKPLSITDVDFRVQSINKGGYATILAYKDARVDMRRLDEVCGANWQKEYKFIESMNMLFCKVGIKIDNEWIWKEDLGTESFAEKQKGQASDAFKRACFNWGIGRELYDYPTISVKLNSSEFELYKDKYGKEKVKQTWNLKLKDWVWDAEFKDMKLVRLMAKDENGVLRFDSLAKNKQQKTTTIPQTTNNSNSNQSENIELPWLNKKGSDKKISRHWQNVVNAINAGKITTIAQVREHYKVNKELSQEIEQLFNYKRIA